MTRPRLAHGQNTTKNEIPSCVLAWLVGKAWKHLRRAVNFIILFLSPSFYRGSNSSRGERYLEAYSWCDNGSKLPPREGKVRRGKEGNFHCSQRPIETFIVVAEGHQQRGEWDDSIDRACVCGWVYRFSRKEEKAMGYR